MNVCLVAAAVLSGRTDCTERFCRTGSAATTLRRASATSTCYFLAKKKTGRKTDYPPGLKLGVMTANDFPRSLTALGANAFFSWLIFSWQLFFAFWPSAFPPFQSANAEGCVKIWSSMSFTYKERSNRHDFFVKHFSRSFANIFMSSRARIFFGAREIFF